MVVPVHVVCKPPKGEEIKIPDDGICFLIGENGSFKRLKNSFYSATVKVEKIKALAEISEEANIFLPPLPYSIIKQAEAFFTAAYDKYKSEAVILLYASPEKQGWHVEVPPQTVQGLHVSYDMKDLPTEIDGYRLFGTIHSHAAIAAFHSGTDDADEMNFDGLHITIGNVDQPNKSYSARWIFSKTKFKCDLAKWIAVPPGEEANPDWLAKVSKPAPIVHAGNPHYPFGPGDDYWKRQGAGYDSLTWTEDDYHRSRAAAGQHEEKKDGPPSNNEAGPSAAASTETRPQTSEEKATYIEELDDFIELLALETLTEDRLWQVYNAEADFVRDVFERIDFLYEQNQLEDPTLLTLEATLDEWIKDGRIDKLVADYEGMADEAAAMREGEEEEDDEEENIFAPFDSRDQIRKQERTNPGNHESSGIR